MRVNPEQRCRAIKDDGARCERKQFAAGLCERHVDNPPRFIAATSGELAKELWMPPDQAEQFQTRIEKLSGNNPRLVDGSDGDQEQ